MDSPETPVAPVGLTVLSDPPEAVIDIVFVHGLQGHPQKTWTLDAKSARKDFGKSLSPSLKVSQNDETRSRIPFHSSKRKRTESRLSHNKEDVDEADDKEEEVQGKAIFWPKDLLQDDFPNARVMTFGYNAGITQSYHAVNQGNIFSHARDLLYSLEAKRRKAAKRHLVFIAHSLGGILVKEVFRRSETDPDPKIQRIFTSTTGVFFFGTPHRGSKDWASFGEGITVVVGLLLGVDKNDKVVRALLPNGPELELCRESFAIQWVKRGESLMVRTFQESKGPTGIRWGGFNELIVPPESSTLDHPNQRARTIDADHIEMVKFSGKHDRNYEMVRDDIEELVMKAEEMVGMVVPEEEVQCTISLPTVEDAYYDSGADQDLPQCHQGTRVSILRQITAWANDVKRKETIFWLYGPAGTGKSTIARSLAHSLANAGQLGASYFFKRGEEGRNGTDLFFPTIASQLINTIPTFKTCLWKSLEKLGNAKAEKKALEDQFKMLIQSPLSKMFPKKSGILTRVIVIDALDECERDKHISQMLSLFLQLQELSTVRLYVFLTSRSANSIVDFFEELGKKATPYRSLALHEEFLDETKADISAFLKARFAAIKAKGKITKDPWPDPKDLHRLVCLATNPSPLFIYAATLCRFVYDDDDGGREEPGDQLELWLEQCDSNAPQLNQIYMPILGQLLSGNYKKAEKPKPLSSKNRSRLLQILSSIILLATPLPMRSLAILLGMDEDKVKHGLQNLHAVLNVSSDSNAPVRLLHKSFSDFLLTQEEAGMADFQVNVAETHAMLASKCILRMTNIHNGLGKDICKVRELGKSRDEIGKEIVANHIPPDLDYACLYWVFHLQQSGRRIEDKGNEYIFLQKHFLHWLEALSLIGKISESTGLIGTLQSLITTDESTQLSRFLHDARCFSLQNRGIINVAPLQLYSSAIIFAPETSTIKQKFKSQIPTWIRRLPKTQSTWNPEVQKLKGHIDKINAVAFSHDGQLLASASDDKTIRLWNPKTGKKIRKLENHADCVNAVAFSHDGQLLASASHDKTVRLWNPVTGEELYRLEGHIDWVNDVAFSHNGQLLASASYDMTVRFWDPVKGEQLRKLESHTGWVNAVTFSHDDQLLASASDDKTVRLWNPVTGKEFRKLGNQIDWVNDGQLLAWASNYKRVRRWNSVTGEKVVTLQGHTHLVNAVAFSHNGQLLASALSEDTVRVWNPVTGEELRKLVGHTDQVNAVAFSHDGQLLASASHDKTVRLWNPVTGEKLRKLEGHTRWVTAVAFSRDDQLLASASDDNTIRLWNPATREEFCKLEGHTDLVHIVVFSYDGQLLASTSPDKTVRLWNPVTGEELYRLEGHTDWIHDVAFSHDGQLLASASADGTVRLWNPITGEKFRKLEGHTDQVNAVAFSHDGRLLASASHDNTVRLWTLATGKEFRKLEGHTRWVVAVVFSRDDKLLASASGDKTVRLWNPATGEELHKLEGHIMWVVAIAFSHDGQLLALGDETVRLWNPATGEKLRILEGHTRWVNAVTFSHDGQLLASASNDKTVRLWNPATGEKLCKLDIDVEIRKLSFSKSGLYLETDRGFLRIQNTCSGILPSQVRGALVEERWVIRDKEKLLWLPPEYRPVCVAIHGGFVALGRPSGLVSILEFAF